MSTARVIFDIDGTLVDSNAFDDELYERAVRDILGNVIIRPSWSDYEHVTDTGILRDICRENGLDDRIHEAAVRRRFGELMEFGYGFNCAVVFDPSLAALPDGRGTFFWDGAAGTWFWVDPTYDVVFVGMIQRMTGPDNHGLLYRTHAAVYGALVDLSKQLCECRPCQAPAPANDIGGAPQVALPFSPVSGGKRPWEAS